MFRRQSSLQQFQIGPEVWRIIDLWVRLKVNCLRLGLAVLQARPAQRRKREFEFAKLRAQLVQLACDRSAARKNRIGIWRAWDYGADSGGSRGYRKRKSAGRFNGLNVLSCRFGLAVSRAFHIGASCERRKRRRWLRLGPAGCAGLGWRVRVALLR